MHQEFQRVQYIKVDKEDKFFSSIAKKYKGRYYKNLKQGAGWSFPFEYKNQIDQQRIEFIEKGSIVLSVDETPTAEAPTAEAPTAETLENKTLNAEAATAEAPTAETLENKTPNAEAATAEAPTAETLENKTPTVEKVSKATSTRSKIMVNNKQTQTDLETHKYKFDLPDTYKNHFIFYKKLIQRTN